MDEWGGPEKKSMGSGGEPVCGLAGEREEEKAGGKEGELCGRVMMN